MAKAPPEANRKCPVCRQSLSGNYCVACGFHDDGAVMSKQLKLDEQIERRSQIFRIKQFVFRLFGISSRH